MKFMKATVVFVFAFIALSFSAMVTFPVYSELFDSFNATHAQYESSLPTGINTLMDRMFGTYSFIMTMFFAFVAIGLILWWVLYTQREDYESYQYMR